MNKPERKPLSKVPLLNLIRGRLVVSRKRNEGVWIGESRVFVIDIRGDKVRLGVEAPPEVGIIRDELVDKVADSLANAAG